MYVKSTACGTTVIPNCKLRGSTTSESEKAPLLKRAEPMRLCVLNSEDAWSPFIVHSRWVGGVAVCGVPGAHPVHLLRSLEVLAHPLTKDVQV